MTVFDDTGGNQAGQSFPANYSYQAIVATAKLSGYYGLDPLVRDTNDLDEFSEGYSYHFTGNAVDFGDDQPNGSPQQTELADWIHTHFGPYTLELIHLNNDGKFYAVKFGQDVGYDYYGDPTMQAHRNHVHWAITNAGLAAGKFNNLGIDIMAQMKTINLNGPLNMQDPIVRTAQGLLMARGGMIKPDNTDHAVFTENLKWFHQQTGLADEGIFGQETWQRVILPLNGK